MSPASGLKQGQNIGVFGDVGLDRETKPKLTISVQACGFEKLA